LHNKTWQQLRISNREGTGLSALLCRSGEIKEGAGRTEEKPLIISCHGFTGSKEGSGRALDMAEQLANLGFNTLLFDFAGCGQSEGDWEDISLSGQIADLGAVVKWCRREGFAKIILNGRSFGGTTVLCYAARDHLIAAVCTWAAVARLTNLFENRVSANSILNGDPDELITLAGEEGVVALKRSFFIDLRKHDPLEAAAAISPRPLLLVHGSHDQSVPLEDANILYQQAAEPKQLAIIEGADHRFSEHLEQVWAAFFSWLNKI